VLATLGSAGLPVVAVNPRRVRDLARSTGRLAKTDALVAQLLAQFAACDQHPGGVVRGRHLGQRVWLGRRRCLPTGSLHHHIPT
jgi:transposase